MMLRALLVLAGLFTWLISAAAQTPSGPSTGTGYPAASVAVSASSGNVAAAAATATLPAAAGRTTYINGFDFTSSGATAASAVTCTITNTVGGTLSYTLAVIAGVSLANAPLITHFNPAIPANAQNTAIVVSCPSLGSGNTNATMTAFGYQKQE